MLEKYLGNLPVKELYKDLFKPGLKKVGEALETVLDGANLILLPLKLLNSKSRVYFQKNMEIYSEKLNQVKNLTPITVPQYYGLPIIDKLTYLDQYELSEAFINLLTKSSFEETLNLVHPAYIGILNNLSTDEAKILFHYKGSNQIPFIDIYTHRYIEKIAKPSYYKSEGVKSREQLREILAYESQNREHTYIKSAWNLTGIENYVDLYFPKNIDIYIENLELNGIISFERTLVQKKDEHTYEDLIENIYKDIINDIETTKELVENSGFKVDFEIRKGCIEFTELGKGFLNSCIKEINNR